MELKQAKDNFELAEVAAQKWGHAGNTRALQELVFGIGVWIENIERDGEDSSMQLYREQEDHALEAASSDSGSEGKPEATKKEQD